MSTHATFQMFVEKIGGTYIEEFTGNFGAIFYDPAVGEFRLGDGITPGGIPIIQTLNANFDGGTSGTVFSLGDLSVDGGTATVTGFTYTLNGGLVF